MSSTAPPRTTAAAPALPALSEADQAALTDLYVRGTPANTLRAYERDLIYVTAWREAAFGAPPEWPEREDVALRFVLDHARDLSGLESTDTARRAAERLIAAGLRRSLACPAPATLDRRIASWRAFHRMKNLASPFDAPLVRQARGKARRAAARPPRAKSGHAITRPVLEEMLATCGPDIAGLRDRALLLLGWASGGRRRAEIAGLRLEDLSLEEAETTGLIRFRLQETKTTARGETPQLVLKGRAARAVLHWIEEAPIGEGFLFRAFGRSGAPLARGLSPDGVGRIVKMRLAAAGYDPGFASAHGLRAGFLTQAALDGAPIQAAMRLSLHRSISQAQSYYDDVEVSRNPATDLLD